MPFNSNMSRTLPELLFLVVAVFSATCCVGQTIPRKITNVIGDSAAEFSSEQGKDGWYYGYWDRSADEDGKYRQSVDFQLLKNFGSDSKNGISAHEKFTTGQLWYLEDGKSYTSLWATGGHANSPRQLGDYVAAEQWAVRRWVSDTSGIVTITGHIGKVMPFGANWGGECKASIIVDGETVFSSVMDEQGLDYAVVVKIHEKSVIDFLIAPDPSIGVVTFTTRIRMRNERP